MKKHKTYFFIHKSWDDYEVHLSISNELQGLGIHWSANNPVAYRDYHLFEIDFFYLRFYAVVYKKQEGNK